MNMLQLLFFVLPLGLDTLGVSISLGIKSHRSSISTHHTPAMQLPSWLVSALLLSLAETIMPLVGLVIGYAASLLISNVMHYIGPLLLIAVGLWELVEETRERLEKRKVHRAAPVKSTVPPAPLDKSYTWGRQLLLALSVSLDELAVGFSLGTVTVGRGVSPLILCILIGLQGFIMTLLGLVLGRTLRTRLRILKDWSELLSGVLLIGLGIWLFAT
nr:manganese efflux pump [Ktedonobacteraceae bacterium]